ncbi:MAG TPA: serine hydrolase [Opitutaceae bacterium]|nr:serine hydrolase [Opitutaceae bacterium]
MTIRPLLLVACLSGTFSWAEAPRDFQKQLENWHQGRAGGAAAAWVDADGVVFAQTGVRGTQDSVPVDADTQFEIGSITKVFTALLLAESEHQGKVRRKDPVGTYLLPAEDAKQTELAPITLLSLVTHTSGLPRLPSNIGPNPDANPDPYANYTRDHLIQALRNLPPPHSEKNRFAYSNFGVALLGEALASAWKTNYDAALRTHILDPLGLRATTLALTGSEAPAHLAPGHTESTVVPSWNFQAFAPAGALRSSARDMGRFLQELWPDSPLRAAIDLTFQPQLENADSGGEVGLGWMLIRHEGRLVAWHNGATHGYRSMIAVEPAAKHGVVVLTNSPLGPEALAFSLLQIKPTQPKVAVENAGDYVGVYPLAGQFAIKVTTAKGALFAQGTGQPRLTLRPVESDRFATIGVAAELRFERDAQGRVTAMSLHQNGKVLRGTRGELPPETQEITLSAEDLEDYVGSYPALPGLTLTVTLEKGTLVLQPTGQPKLPLHASAKDQFFSRSVDFRISFQRDPAGQINGLILHQGGRDLPAKKSP